jgi:hypothetical protein
MIVRARNGGLLLIRQPDHAALAQRIMSHWTALDKAARRESILLAVGEHDSGWHGPDSAPLVDAATGRILDFVGIPLDVRQGVWPRAVAHLAADPWAAALVAQHAVFVYARFRGKHEWDAFFARMEHERERFLHQVSGATQDELVRDYAFVRLGDLASLTFCCGWTDAQQFAGFTMHLQGSRLVIEPDPFNGRDVAIEVTARELPNRRYASDSEAARTFESARPFALHGTVAGAPHHA